MRDEQSHKRYSACSMTSKLRLVEIILQTLRRFSFIVSHTLGMLSLFLS